MWEVNKKRVGGVEVLEGGYGVTNFCINFLYLFVCI